MIPQYQGKTIEWFQKHLINQEAELRILRKQVQLLTKKLIIERKKNYQCRKGKRNYSYLGKKDGISVDKTEKIKKRRIYQ